MRKNIPVRNVRNVTIYKKSDYIGQNLNLAASTHFPSTKGKNVYILSEKSSMKYKRYAGYSKDIKEKKL